eukprot:CAMPEP_0180544208 /NCGR_PEP_ID=MMETSP1036_2-20121128/69397_1 /TAXON_ID=632150 /ORGANISM="Azadinium spinosum, Strain 3D9" /LENGTH=72 /DNA_ID=CAMNT_0022559195 /DNA_START=1 /DNA_END=215 /DNA_ORIENTATION=+
MDSRAFRLDVPPQMVVVEVDEAAVHAAKQSILDSASQRSRCAIRRIEVNMDGGLGAAQLLDALAPALGKGKA